MSVDDIAFDDKRSMEMQKINTLSLKFEVSKKFRPKCVILLSKKQTQPMSIIMLSTKIKVGERGIDKLDLFSV